MSVDMAHSQPRLLVLAGPEVMSDPAWPAMWRYARCEFAQDPYATVAKLAGNTGAFDALVLSSKGLNAILLTLVRLIKRHHLGLPIYLMDTGGAKFRLEQVLQLGILPLNVLPEKITPESTKEEQEAFEPLSPSSATQQALLSDIAEKDAPKDTANYPPEKGEETFESPAEDELGVNAELCADTPIQPVGVDGGTGYDAHDLEPLLTEAELEALLGTGR